VPLQETEFEFAMSDAVIALDRSAALELTRRWPDHARSVEYWSSPRVDNPDSRPSLAYLARELRAYFAVLRRGPLPAVVGVHSGTTTAELRRPSSSEPP
jgi:hypothetical protein